MFLVSEYFSSLYKLHFKVFSWPFRKIVSNGPLWLSLPLKNFFVRISGNKHYFDFDYKINLYFVMDGDQKHYFGHRARGFSLYNKGISKRAKDIFDSYLLSKVDFRVEDIVVDCGANYGDLWLSLKGLIKPKNYITFEPSLDEYRSLTFNAADSIHNKLGLGNFDGKSKFYVNNGEADSCVIEPVRYSEIIEISLIKIDSYITLNAIEKIKLLKLEAEGFEPEILDGALKSLHKIEWIALDGGYERGVNMQETFSAATNTLLKNGFEMKGVIFHPSARALFRRL